MPSLSISAYHAMVLVTLICVAVDTALHPLLFVTSTVYVPASVTLNVEAVPTGVVPLNHL
ncbi:hypothetical protein [uncultured Cytophaga sp.]|uniref:hypothetical protein n=1 Tax=uncultured Cytophaga sp. TaxID=160238 RepID=UPI002629D6C5|nr:hypothetical protein [uncultured Cytophaga sp.]